MEKRHITLQHRSIQNPKSSQNRSILNHDKNHHFVTKNFEFKSIFHLEIIDKMGEKLMIDNMFD